MVVDLILWELLRVSVGGLRVAGCVLRGYYGVLVWHVGYLGVGVL